MKGIAAFLLKVFITLAVGIMMLQNANLVWAALPPAALWFVVESRDYGQYTLYRNVALFVAPASIMPFFLIGLRITDLDPYRMPLYWLALGVPTCLGFAAAWFLPRIAENAALRALVAENADIARASEVLLAEWGDILNQPFRNRPVYFEN